MFSVKDNNTFFQSDIKNNGKTSHVKHRNFAADTGRTLRT